MQSKNAIRLALFALGFLSIGSQVFLIREFLSVFYGNELVLGIVLSTWLLLTAMGSWLGRFTGKMSNPSSFILFLLLLLSILPSLMLIKLDLLKVMLFPYGSMVGLWGIIYASFLIQLPFCLANGYLFTNLSVRLVIAGNDRFIPQAYSFESLGSLVSGVIVNFILLWWCNAFDSLSILAFCYLALIVAYAVIQKKKPVVVIAAMMSVVLLSLLIFPDWSGISEAMLYRGQKVLSSKGTPYGQVVITENEGQLNFYENGMLLFSSGNVISNEESVHLAMVQHPLPENVLMISGGLSGALEEILKYHPLKVDYVELNPALIRIAKRFSTLVKDTSVRIIETDARRFIKSTGNKYDVVLINLPEPSTIQVNRFYTLEFFRELKQRLRPGAVISMSLPTSSQYVSEKAGQVNSATYRTLASVFRNVSVIPAGKNYFLASDRSLSLDIPGMIAKKNIPTSYVNGWYLDTRQMEERSSYILNNIQRKGTINHDFRPVVYLYQLQFQLSYFHDNLWIVGLIFLVIILLSAFTLNPVNAGLFTGGFTAASGEILILVALQVTYGYVFQMAGVVIMLFMMGLALGSMLTNRIFPRPQPKYYVILQLVLAIYSIVLSFGLLWLSSSHFPDWFVQVTLAAATLVVAILVGLEYGLASGISLLAPSRRISGNYSADLIGSAFGAFCSSVFLFPLLGIIGTGMFLALLNTISAFILFFRHKKNVTL